MDNYIGRLLDNRYEILESIGAGGMAVVYKARCHRLNRMVAIKVLKDELSVDAEFRRRFHAESQAVAMLSHPNIVNVYDVSHSDNVDYIVMELIEGLTLKQYMQQKGTLNWREALHLSTQIAKALEHAHGRGIIHRDIKPHNIMILKDGTVKVADFGIARVSSAQNTLTREALGSVHYISPEQAKGGKIDYRSDIYSLGVVMYEMLTGRTPYDGETPVAVAIKHINAKAELPRTINPQIPAGMEHITMHAMAADLEMRYETATAMLADLDDFRRNPKINFQEGSGAGRNVGSSRNVLANVEKKNVEKQHLRAKQSLTSVRQKRKGNNSVALVSGVIAILLALILIGAFLIFFLDDIFDKTDEIEVPQFVGMQIVEIDYNQYPNLQIVIHSTQTSDPSDVGKVIKQEPQGGEIVKKGSVVYLTVSSGPAINVMPDLKNETEQSARSSLRNLWLDLQIEAHPESSKSIAEGMVIRTIPEAGEALAAGQLVALIISSGDKTDTGVLMPDLCGKDVEYAKAFLAENGLEFSVEEKDAAEVAGAVIYQSVEQMEYAQRGTTVILHVSRGNLNHGDVEASDENAATDPKTIWVPKPDMDSSVTIRVLIDGAEVYNFTADDTSLPERGIAVSADVQGVHKLEVFLDEQLWYSETYNFDTGELVKE